MIVLCKRIRFFDEKWALLPEVESKQKMQKNEISARTKVKKDACPRRADACNGKRRTMCRLTKKLLDFANNIVKISVKIGGVICNSRYGLIKNSKKSEFYWHFFTTAR